MNIDGSMALDIRSCLVLREGPKSCGEALFYDLPPYRDDRSQSNMNMSPQEQVATMPTAGEETKDK